MQRIEMETHIGDLISEYPYIEDILKNTFVDRHMDFRCNVNEFSQSINVTSNKLLFYLNIAVNSDPKSSVYPLDNIPLERLIDYIEMVHHKFAKVEFKNIQIMLDKCLYKFKGSAYKKIVTLHNKFIDFRNRLKFHMIKEETVIFPLICEFEDYLYGYCHRRSFDPSTIITLIQQIQDEHEEHISCLKTMEAITAEFTLEFSQVAEGEYLAQKLHKLLEDIKRHIFLEDHILFAHVIKASGHLSQELIAV